MVSVTNIIDRAKERMLTNGTFQDVEETCLFWQFYNRNNKLYPEDAVESGSNIISMSGYPQAVWLTMNPKAYQLMDSDINLVSFDKIRSRKFDCPRSWTATEK